MDASKNSVFSGEDFDKADHMGEIRRRPKLTCADILRESLVILETILPPKCDHDWPEGDQGTDMNGSCTKCDMSFMFYIHVLHPCGVPMIFVLLGFWAICAVANLFWSEK